MQKRYQLPFAEHGYFQIIRRKLICFLLLGMVAGAINTNARAAATSKPPTVFPQPDPWQKILAFSDAEFYSLTQNALLPREDRLLETSLTGIAISAPSMIDPQRPRDIPVVFGSKTTGYRDWELPLSYNTYLTAVNPTTGKLYCSNALLNEKDLKAYHRTSPVIGPKPFLDDLESEGVQIRLLNAGQKLALPGKTATWLIRIIYYDWISNTAVIANPRGSLEANITDRGKMLNQLKKLTPDKFKAVSFIPGPGENASGKSMRIQYQSTGKKHRLLIRGTFQCVILPHNRVATKTIHTYSSGSVLRVQAAIPVSLLILRKNGVQPFQLAFSVPVYEIPDKAHPIVQAYFSIDGCLLKPSLKPRPGSYAGYLFYADKLLGPSLFAVDK